MALPGPNWQRRAQALLDAAADVAPTALADPGYAAASAQHQQLFHQYLAELQRAKRGADLWWQALIDTEQQRTGDRAEALRRVRERRPLGPVIEPKVIGTVRKFWLACAALNQRSAPAAAVPPQALVLGWLLAEGHHELARFLAGLPYWPLGLDRQGNWV